jgi:hypothetical protein
MSKAPVFLFFAGGKQGRRPRISASDAQYCGERIPLEAGLFAVPRSIQIEERAVLYHDKSGLSSKKFAPMTRTFSPTTSTSIFRPPKTRFARMGRMGLRRFSPACGMPQRGGRFQPRASALLTPI